MIGPRDIEERVREWGLREDIVEKDYVLGWLLAAIAGHPRLGETWIFKGGTCLKKCYFETYRFSEDLDFTVVRDGPETPEELLPVFQEIAAWVYRESGIDVPADSIRFETYRNPRGNPSTRGSIAYRGPLPRAQRGDLPRIRLDVTSDEILVRSGIKRAIAHPYPDTLSGDGSVLAYDQVEIFAEKIRALADRQRPRDLYDVLNLFWRSQKPSPGDVRAALEAKCRFKGIPLPSIEFINRANGRAELEADWEHMLAHQVADLPPLSHYLEELPKLFSWLEETAIPPELVSVPVFAEEEPSWAPPPTMATWGVGIPLEKIRYAGANRLCIELGYQGSIRTVEPYSLRRTRDGTLLLHAIRIDNREHRSYRIDRVTSVRVTDRPFTPVYTVEFSPTGPIAALPSAPRITTARFGHRRPTQRNSGITYLIECPACGRRFRRAELDTTLRPHKDKNGWSCGGQMGYLVDSRYN